MNFKPEKYFIKVTLIENDYVNYTSNLIGFTNLKKNKSYAGYLYCYIGVL